MMEPLSSRRVAADREPSPTLRSSTIRHFLEDQAPSLQSTSAGSVCVAGLHHEWGQGWFPQQQKKQWAGLPLTLGAN